MRNVKNTIIAAGILVTLSLTGLAQSTAPASEKTAAFDPHDLSGVWVKGKGFAITMTNVPPLTPKGQALFNATKPGYGARAVPPGIGNDPMGTCDPNGIPRLLFLETGPYGIFEFAPIQGRMIQFFEWEHVWRTIWTDGRSLPKDPDPSWLGNSVGSWDGDTFVVQSNGFDDRTWVDHFGDLHSDALQLEERYRRVDHDTMEFRMIMTDPEIYTKPWDSGPKILKLDPKAQVVEHFCVPTEEQAFNKRMRDPAAGKTDK